MKHRIDFITSIELELARELPGKEVQYEMAAADRPHFSTKPRHDVRSAAVLLTLFIKNGAWHTIIFKRKSHPGDRHGGQISFPGGSQEAGEELSETAVRESHEEVGTPALGVQIIGALTQLHIPISNYMVYPFVGYIEKPGALIPQLSEVDQIFEVSLDSILATEACQKTDLHIPEGLLLRNVPYFALAGQVVWGATAMILNEFVAVVQSVSSGP